MNNYLCYHVHQHSVQPIYVRQTPTVILHTQQRLPISLDLPPQNIILRNEEPQPIIVRQQNPNVIIQNENHGFQIDPESIDQIHHITNNNMNHLNNVNVSNEISTRNTSFLNTFGNIVDTNLIDYRNIMNIQEKPLNQTRTMQQLDINSQIPSQITNTQTFIENQGSPIFENEKEIGIPMSYMEENQFNKIDNLGYISKSNNMYTSNNNNNYNYSSPYSMMNYQMEQLNYNSPVLNNPISYIPSISTNNPNPNPNPNPNLNHNNSHIPSIPLLPPPSIHSTLPTGMTGSTNIIGTIPSRTKTNTNINIPYVNNPTSYMQNKNINYVNSNENINYYPRYKY